MTADENIVQGRYIFEISCLCEKGGRPVNEDSVIQSHDRRSVMIAVADGLGGHGGGDTASKIAIDIAGKEYMELKKPRPKNISGIFQNINDAIVAEQTDDIKMKTTLSCVLCRDNWLYGAHLGDTRIYTFNSGGKFRLTADHSAAYEEVMKNKGGLNDLRNNPNRHILSAALGVGNMRPPDIFRQRIRRNLSVLICSDGFWEYVDENDMVRTLENTGTSREWLDAMMKRLTMKAGRFNDNYSAICLRIK